MAGPKSKYLNQHPSYTLLDSPNQPSNQDLDLDPESEPLDLDLEPEPESVPSNWCWATSRIPKRKLARLGTLATCLLFLLGTGVFLAWILVCRNASPSPPGSATSRLELVMSGITSHSMSISISPESNFIQYPNPNTGSSKGTPNSEKYPINPDEEYPNSEEDSSNPDEESRKEGGDYSPFEKVSFLQPIDHTDPSFGYFNQSIYINREFYKPGGPVWRKYFIQII
ncbi:hypothetical protein AYI68_g4090 [Smittium mucronatum]|uniref:Uncharacterized protein n=1 Tax=Smittium mucronatum TaxID=133383 RepID=A0A1R0GY30_9FUNG|nr:hypothetical protein AYI68_g4090 [Smittium mucronatum]